MKSEAARPIERSVLTLLIGGVFVALWQASNAGEHLEVNIGGCIHRCMLQIRKKAICIAVCAIDPHAY